MKRPPPSKTSPRETAAALQHLRSLARDIHHHTLARIEGDIAHVLRCLTHPADDARARRQQRRDLDRMLALVHQVDVRPHKGRTKDVRRLDKIVNRLTAIVDQW